MNLRANQHGRQTPPKWKAKYGGLQVSEVRRLKDLEAENGKLKKLLAGVNGLTATAFHRRRFVFCSFTWRSKSVAEADRYRAERAFFRLSLRDLFLHFTAFVVDAGLCSMF